LEEVVGSEEQLRGSEEQSNDFEESDERTVQDDIKEEPTEEEDNEQQNGVLITKPLKYRGKEIWVNSEEEAIELMQKGLDYSFKMNKIKPHRSIVNIVEEAGLSVEDIKALADAKSGKQEAIRYIVNKFGLEPQDDDFVFDDDTQAGSNEEYKPEVKPQDPVLEIYQEVANREPELAGKVSKIWDELEDTFKQELYNPDVFRAFIGSVKTGEFEKVLPEAVKVKALNPGVAWLQAYQYAVQNIGSIQRQTQEPSEAVKPKQPSRPKKRKTIKESYDEIWDKSIDELEKEIFG